MVTSFYFHNKKINGLKLIIFVINKCLPFTIINNEKLSVTNFISSDKKKSSRNYINIGSKTTN